MANTTYTPRFTAISESGDRIRLYAVINYTIYIGTESKKKVIRFPVRNLTTGKSYKFKKNLWNKSRNCCKVNVGTPDDMNECKDANRVMKSIVKAVSDIIEDCKLHKNTFSPSMLNEKKIYETIHKTNKINVIDDSYNKLYFTDYWKNFIDRAEKGEIRYSGNKYNEVTLKAYRKCLNSLLKYQEEINYKFDFDEINNDFFISYLSHLEKRLMRNSICEHFRRIKHLMKISRKEGFHTNMQYENFIIKEEDVDNIYLSEDELSAIAQLDLTGSRLDKYRDIFLIGCYTGLRISDLLRIKKEHFHTSNGVEMLKIRTHKSPTGVFIPFLWKDLKYRLEKYDYNLPRISEQHLRKEAKEVGRLAGINSSVIVETGRYKNPKPYEKWQLISSHTCRRTACTNMFKRGIPVKQIMMISGHKKESTFYKYIKITEEENAIMLAQKFGML